MMALEVEAGDDFKFVRDVVLGTSDIGFTPLEIHSYPQSNLSQVSLSDLDLLLDAVVIGI
jgi:hypothetical protein